VRGLFQAIKDGIWDTNINSQYALKDAVKATRRSLTPFEISPRKRDYP